MLISVAEIRRFWGQAPPPRVVHVGAHLAEELDSYEANGWGQESTVWIEAIPNQAELVRETVRGRPHHRVIQAVAWDNSGSTVYFHVANNVQSSSVLDFGTHSLVHPEIVMVDELQLVTTAIADLDIWSGKRDTFLNLDIQGAELLALRGLGARIRECLAIYCEVNLSELYVGCPLVNDIDAFLQEHGFWRADQEILTEYGWGDALYLPSGVRWKTRKMRRFARKMNSKPILNHIRRIVTRLVGTGGAKC